MTDGTPEVPPVAEWLRGSGPESDIVLSSRIRLARNVVGFPLRARLGEDESHGLCEHLQPRVEAAGLGHGLSYLGLEHMTDIERLVLVERHVISLEHANGLGDRGVLTDAPGTIALMLNEEDHLRIQCLASGLELTSIFERSREIERKLSAVVDFAFHARFGYLTSCPTNVGTGMRISVMLHLPALVFAKQIDKVFNSVAKMNLAVRGFYGEGTKALSDLYQISNQVTLGRSAEKLLEDVRRVLPKIVAFERDVRKQLVENDRLVLEDRVWRALGILRTARTIASEEAFEHLSLVRMGIHLGLIEGLDIERVNKTFNVCQPGHLQASQGGTPLDTRHRDIVRARLIRETLA